MRKKGFTLIELLVVIAIIAMLLAILMPALSKVKKIAQRVVCATNLKGMGTAQVVYANDYDDEYAVQGGGLAHTWSNVTDNWQNAQGDTTNPTNTVGNITVGASLYLLVREADVSPKSFICPSGSEQEFDGKNPSNLDIVELYDFGSPAWPTDKPMGPEICVSYSYHQPYAAGGATGTQQSGSKGRYAADGSRSAAFAIMADKSPYYDQKLICGGANQDNFIDRSRLLIWEDTAEKWETQSANSQPHGREGQNVAFGDGHASYEKRTDIGVKYDMIYTRWVGTGIDENDRRQGMAPDRDAGATPAGSTDSVLVNDDLVVPVTGV